MRDKRFDSPRRVWINQPSTLQPHHDLDGRVGIAINDGSDTTVYFVVGHLVSMMIDPACLETVNSQSDIFEENA